MTVGKNGRRFGEASVHGTGVVSALQVDDVRCKRRDGAVLGVPNPARRRVAPMSDHWQLAKRVMIWNEEPPLPEPGRRADATTALLTGIARALQADQATEVDRLCRHAMRDSPDAFIPAMFLAARLLNAPTGVDEAEELILRCGIQENPERRAYAAALLAFAWAWRHERAPSERHAAEALAALEDVEDDAVHRLGRDAADAGGAVARRHGERERARGAVGEPARARPRVYLGREHPDVSVLAEHRARRRRGGARRFSRGPRGWPSSAAPRP